MRFLRVARGRAAKAKSGPWKAAGVRAWDLLFELAFWGCGCAGEARVAACSIVVAAACGVGQCVVGVVDLLKFLGAGAALG